MVHGLLCRLRQWPPMTSSLPLKDYLKAHLPPPAPIAMKFIDELCTRLSFSLLLLALSLTFSFRSKKWPHTWCSFNIHLSHTRMASLNMAHFCSHVVSFPVSLTCRGTLCYPTWLASQDDHHSVGAAISLISVYWGLALLMLGSCITSVRCAVVQLACSATHCSWMVCF